jgi:hypothetical protein
MDRLDQLAEKYWSIIDVAVGPLDEAVKQALKDAMVEYSEQSSCSPEDFDVFWKKYGKKVGRTPALKKFMKLKRVDIEKILATVDDFVIAHPDVQFRPHPLTYINQRRWEDELPGLQQRKHIIAEVKKNTWTY